jgi:hypothetical protein
MKFRTKSNLWQFAGYSPVNQLRTFGTLGLPQFILTHNDDDTNKTRVQHTGNNRTSTLLQQLKVFKGISE